MRTSSKEHPQDTIYIHLQTIYTLSCLPQDTPNVIGVMVLNNEGFPIKSNLDNTTTVQYGHMIADLAEKVGHILEKNCRAFTKFIV